MRTHKPDLDNDQTKNSINKLFEEYFPSEEERLDKEIKYYKDLLIKITKTPGPVNKNTGDDNDTKTGEVL